MGALAIPVRVRMIKKARHIADALELRGGDAPINLAVACARW